MSHQGWGDTSSPLGPPFDLLHCALRSGAYNSRQFPRMPLSLAFKRVWLIGGQIRNMQEGNQVLVGLWKVN